MALDSARACSQLCIDAATSPGGRGGYCRLTSHAPPRARRSASKPSYSSLFVPSVPLAGVVSFSAGGVGGSPPPPSLLSFLKLEARKTLSLHKQPHQFLAKSRFKGSLFALDAFVLPSAAPYAKGDVSSPLKQQ